MALCITENGLKAIDVNDQATAAPNNETSVRPAPAREVAAPAPEAIASGKRIPLRHRILLVRSITRVKSWTGRPSSTLIAARPGPMQVATIVAKRLQRRPHRGQPHRSVSAPPTLSLDEHRRDRPDTAQKQRPSRVHHAIAGRTRSKPKCSRCCGHRPARPSRRS